MEPFGLRAARLAPVPMPAEHGYQYCLPPVETVLQLRANVICGAAHFFLPHCVVPKLFESRRVQCFNTFTAKPPATEAGLELKIRWAELDLDCNGRVLEMACFAAGREPASPSFQVHGFVSLAAMVCALVYSCVPVCERARVHSTRFVSPENGSMRSQNGLERELIA